MNCTTEARWMLVTACLLGATAVMSGAFGAHALRDVLGEQSRDWYDTAVTYQARHALALLACGLLTLHAGNSQADSPGNSQGRSWAGIAAICFTLGTLIFSGTLYIMAFTQVTRLGMITPVGGLLLIIAWLSLGVAVVRLSSREL